MAAAAISLIDRLIQLLSVREKNRERYFKNFIEPLYIDAEKIAADYMKLLIELIHRIDDSGDGREIVEWLEVRSVDLQPVRVKIRAMIKDGSMQEQADSDEWVGLFCKGLWGLLRGSISSVSDGQAMTSDYGFGDHTVLDLLKRTRESIINPDFHERLVGHAVRQRTAIALAWKDVTTAYAGLRAEYLR